MHISHVISRMNHKARKPSNMQPSGLNVDAKIPITCGTKAEKVLNIRTLFFFALLQLWTMPAYMINWIHCYCNTHQFYKWKKDQMDLQKTALRWTIPYMPGFIMYWGLDPQIYLGSFLFHWFQYHLLGSWAWVFITKFASVPASPLVCRCWSTKTENPWLKRTGSQGMVS